MKFALISASMLLLATITFGCKRNNGATQELPPKKEVSAPKSTKESEQTETPIKLQQPPKEQKSDRSIKNKKPKNALDTLRPKTA